MVNRRSVMRCHGLILSDDGAMQHTNLPETHLAYLDLFCTKQCRSKSNLAKNTFNQGLRSENTSPKVEI